jgi:hypothetical protein
VLLALAVIATEASLWLVQVKDNAGLDVLAATGTSGSYSIIASKVSKTQMLTRVVKPEFILYTVCHAMAAPVEDNKASLDRCAGSNSSVVSYRLEFPCSMRASEYP